MSDDRVRVARRMGDIQPFHVMDLLARARELERSGRNIVHMEIGEPDFITPEPVIRAGQRALEEGRTGYTPALGIAELREALAGFYADRYNVAIDPARIVVTPGASGALQLFCGTLLNPGDRLLLTDPGYPCNRNFARLVEAEAVAMPVGPETGYQPTAAVIDRMWDERTVAALLASPANPTGMLIEENELARIAGTVAAHGGQLVVDEIYHGLVYEGATSTVLAVSDDAFVVNSFSKYFGMTGWRLGWMVAPEGYVRELEKLAQNIFISAATPAQYAALAAFEPETIEILEARREAFRERRDFLMPALRQLGFGIPQTPAGAFYIYADSSRFSNDSYAFAWRVLEETGVAITPGIDFGHYRAAEHVRFAYTTSLERLEEGVARLARFLGPSS